MIITEDENLMIQNIILYHSQPKWSIVIVIIILISTQNIAYNTTMIITEWS